MTGIVGYACADKLDVEPLETMINSIKHRDDCMIDKFYGSWLRISRIHLGIFDSKKQPIFNEDKTLGIVMYGKIHNEYERGFDDATYILREFESRGSKIFEELNGTFAMAIFDDQKRELLLVTDRFGTRPLYYALREGTLIFSSHSRAILKYPVFPRDLNERTLVKFLMFGRIGILGDETWFKGINLMPPASILKFNGRNLTLERYWDLEYQCELDEKKAVPLLVKKFRKAVNSWAESVVDGLCLMLSGGLDSRSVLETLNVENLRKVTAVTFGTRDCDDVAIAKIVAKKFGVKHSVITYDPNELVKYAEDVVYLTDGQDTVNVAFIPYVAEKLKKMGFKCFLQGYMFDLTLGGSFLSKEALNSSSLSSFINHLVSKYSVFSIEEMKKLLNPKLHGLLNSVLKEFYEIAANSRGDCSGNRNDYFAINTRVRRYTLMGSVINRYFLEELLPTIDKDLIDVIRRIPPHLRFNHKIYRKFLISLNPELAKIPYQKTLLPPIIPTSLWCFSHIIHLLMKFLQKISKGRIGYSHTYFDFNNIIRYSKPWKKLVEDALLNEISEIYKRNLINKDYVNEIVRDHMNGKNNGEKIAFLISLELVLRLFFS